MSFRRLGRMLAAASLITASAGILAAAPAGANPITVNCPSAQTPLEIQNGDTVSWIVGTGCTSAGFANNPSNPNPNYGTLVLNGNTTITPGNGHPVMTGDTLVYTAPASGTSNDFIYFNGNAPSTQAEFPISAPPASGAFVDNANGSITVTYTGEIVLFLFTQGTTCPPSLMGQFRPLYVLDSGPYANPGLTASPATITAGTMAMGTGGPGGSAIAAGTYQACLYYPNLMSNPPVQFGEVTLGTVTPVFTG